MQIFAPWIPYVPTELVAFPQPIGEPDAELILKESIWINRIEGDDNFGDVVSLTAQQVLSQKRGESYEIYSLNDDIGGFLKFS